MEKRTCRSDELAWYAFISDFNAWTIKPYNIFNNYTFYKDIRKAARKYRDAEREQFEEELLRELRYCFWSKAEWEIILQHWPPREDSRYEQKVDVFDQVMLNWDVFKEYVWANRSVLRRREKGDAG